MLLLCDTNINTRKSGGTAEKEVVGDGHNHLEQQQQYEYARTRQL